MLNEAVVHRTYGNGNVIRTREGHITVMFQGLEEEKTFQYPEAFETYLQFTSSRLQAQAKDDLEQLKLRKNQEQEQKQKLYELREAERKKEQRELLRRRRKAAKERQEREKRQGGMTA